MPENPKINKVLSKPKGVNAAFVYLCGLAYSGKHGTYGAIPRTALPFIHGTPKEARMLVEAGLWTVAEYGWDIHDWNAHQPTEEYVKSRKEKARKAAEARWKPKPEDAPPPLDSAGPTPF